MSGKGFTEAEILAAAWSKAQKSTMPVDTRLSRSGGTSFLHRDDRPRDFSNRTRYGDRDGSKSHRPKRSHRSRSRSKSRNRERHSRRRNSSERPPPSYSPYRGQNAHGRESPTYSPYRGVMNSRDEVQDSRRQSRSRSPSQSRSRSRPRYRSSSRSRQYYGRANSRSLSRSRSRSRESPGTLARLPPPQDPVRPYHDDRDAGRGHGHRHDSDKNRDRYKHRSRSRSSSSSDLGFSRGTESHWTHDKYMRALRDRYGGGVGGGLSSGVCV